MYYLIFLLSINGSCSFIFKGIKSVFLRVSCFVFGLVLARGISWSSAASDGLRGACRLFLV